MIIDRTLPDRVTFPATETRSELFYTRRRNLGPAFLVNPQDLPNTGVTYTGRLPMKMMLHSAATKNVI